MTARQFFLLGARDPEMDMMQKLLQERGEQFTYAMKNGVRTHAGNAYLAEPVVVPEGHRLVVIECEPANIADFPDFIRIDHHRPGDPGYDLGPPDFWVASSIGQLFKVLNREAVVMAAHDHCFQAAMRGECPGISPKDVLEVKIRGIAASAGVTEDEVRDWIDGYTSDIDYSPEVQIGDQLVRDLRRFDLGVGYSLKVLAAQVAGAMSGHAVLLRHRHREDGPEVWSLRGNARSETVLAFMNDWAPAQGLENIHGNPGREYAGGYVAVP